MKRTSITARFLGGFEPIELPPSGPDGMIPAGPPHIGLPVVQPPSLCEAGPCRHYHRLVTVMDVQAPVKGTDPARRQTTRACYPEVGIELEIGETPVLQCSRWYPVAEPAYVIDARDAYLVSEDGQAFAEQVAEFETACQGEIIQPNSDIDDRSCAAYAREFTANNGGAT